MKKILLLLIIAFTSIVTPVFADTYIAVKNGDWDSPDTWGRTSWWDIPLSSDTAIIPAGIEVTIDNTYEFVAKLIIEEDGKLSALSTYYSSWLEVYDSLIVDGILEGDLYQSGGSLTSDFDVYMYGDVLTGTGLIKYGTFYVENDLTIPSDADLSFYLMVFSIDGSYTVTNYGKINIEQRIEGANSNSTWVNADDAYLEVGGVILNTGKLYAYAKGNTVQYDGLFGTFPIKIPEKNQYYNLTIASLNRGYMSDSLIILNDLRINSGTLDPQQHQIRIYGDWYQYGKFLSDGSRVIFCGSRDQNIIASNRANFSTLYLDNAPYKIISAKDIWVTDTLRLNSTVVMNSYDFLLGRNQDTLGVLNYVSGKILGRVSRWINSSSTDFLYPIGTQNLTTFAYAKFPSIASPGIVSFQFIDSFPGNDTLPITDITGLTVYNVFGDGYWIADTSNGFDLGSNTYDLTLKGEGFTAFDITDSTRIVFRPSIDSVWRFIGQPGTNDPSNDLVSRIELNAFPGQFAFADTTNCKAPLITTINGPADVCRGATNVLYTTDTSSTNTFFWTVTGGTIVQDNGDSIIVDWEDNGEVGQISVYAQNSCSFGNTYTKTINVHSIPPSEIIGLHAVPEQSDSVIYIISALNNYDYDWFTSSNASVDSVVPTDDTAWVSFTDPGYDTIYVVASYNGGCQSDTAAFPIYVYDIINSQNSGNWHDPNTWDCHCIPQYNDNVRIKNGHNVLVDLYYDGKVYTYENFVNRLFVERNATLTIDVDNYVDLYVNGDLYNDGTINYNSVFLLLNSNLDITGQGTINTNLLYVGGTRDITAGSSLIVNGDVDIDENDLLNYGSLFINGDLKAASAGTFVNEANSYLFVSDSLLTNDGNLVSDATGNTVEYGGSQDQAIKPQASSSNGYYNLVLSGKGNKILGGDITILSNLRIIDTAVFDLNTYNVTIYGDWYDYSKASDPLIEGTQQVLFNGNGEQHIYSPYIETFYDLKIGKNSNLIVPPQQFLNINGTFYVDGQVTLEFNNYHDTLPSIVYANDPVYGDNGVINTNLIIKAKTWHEVSPAIIGVTSDKFTLANGRFNSNLYWYDESVDLDNNPGTEPGGDFNQYLLSYGWKHVDDQDDGVNYTLKLNNGYLFYDEQTDTIIMSGQVAQVSVNFDTTISFTPNDPDDDSDTLPNFYDGWNVLGNPYIAYLSIDSILNNSTGVDNGIYVWDDDNNQYAGYQNGFRVLSGRLGPYIPPLQGFAIHANSSGAQVKIRPQYRLHAHQMYLKQTNSTNDYKRNAIKLALSANNHTDYFVTYFYQGASQAYESKFDMLHLNANPAYYPQLPNLYTKSAEGYDLALNGLSPEAMDYTVVPLYVKVGQNGTYTLQVPYINGLENQVVLLKDLRDSSLHRLTPNFTYTFNYNTADPEHRFDLLIIRDNPPHVTNTIDEQQAYEDSLFVLDLSRYFADRDWFDTLKFYVQTDGNTWLRLEGTKLVGTPTQEFVGDYTITVIAYDILNKSATQTFDLHVINTNDPPQLINPLPEFTAKAGLPFDQRIPENTFVDVDPDDQLTYFAENLPDWLKFNAETNTLSGVPTSQDVGTTTIVIGVHDLAGATAKDTIKLKVFDNPFIRNKDFTIYPNPAVDKITVFINSDLQQGSLLIYTLDGRLIQKYVLSSNYSEFNVANLPSGVYVAKIIIGNRSFVAKFTKL